MGFVLPPDDPRNPKIKKKSNVSDGRDSQDMEVAGDLVAFINRNVTPYPTEVGGPKFDLVPIKQQKDIMLNVSRMHAQQEYDRIMALVAVLQQQAESVRRRLQITDWVHAANYSFQIYHGQCYWLAHDLRHGGTLLTQTGPKDWTTGQPVDWEYICRVKWLGDYTWMEVDNNGHDVV
jgi:hypothetical protein